MTEPIATTPAHLMAAIHADFSRWASTQRGKVYIARDLENAMTLLDNNPAGWTAVLHWEGDVTAGTGTRRGGVVENNLRVFLKANLGPSAQPDIALINPTAARATPVMDTISVVRKRLLQYTFPGVRSPGDRLAYKGCSDQASIGGYLVAVYSLLFGIFSVIDVPADADLIALNVQQ
jgi:hypothetical protein